MNQCVVITNYVTNTYRKELLQSHINLFKSKNIDVILLAAEHIAEYPGVSNYITINYPKWDRAFITEGIFPWYKAGNKTFWVEKSYPKINSLNYFIKLNKTAFTYCHNLGYEFVYELEFDSILKPAYIDSVLAGNIDFSKIYFSQYSWIPDALNCSFFFGNIKNLLQGFTDEKLDYIENLAKTKLVLGGENAMFELFKDNEHLILLDYALDEMFDEFNLFSISNIADIFYDSDDKKYLFFFIKGDRCKNQFSCELLLDGNIIFSRTSSYQGEWACLPLDFDKNYTIKYYDNHISTDTLHRTKTIYTDSKQNTVSNWSKNN